MTEGDYVLVNDSVYTSPEYARHGLVIRMFDAIGAAEVLFADGVIEDYYPSQVIILTDKQYFKLQLGAKSL